MLHPRFFFILNSNDTKDSLALYTSQGKNIHTHVHGYAHVLSVCKTSVFLFFKMICHVSESSYAVSVLMISSL